MTMDDVVKSCNCKYAKWTTGNQENISTTAWIECKLKDVGTDPDSCIKCKERCASQKERTV